MTEMERIHDQMKRAFGGPAWHGPAVLEALEGVSAAGAMARPIGSAHTIGEITRHIAAWKRIVARRLTEGKSFEVSDAMDFPAADAIDEHAWRGFLAELTAAHEELLAAVAKAPAQRIDEPLVPKGNTGYVQLHGVVQHDLYHAGQIVLLKKALP
jgi:uncharacterized damage-inducible protein DinB